MQMMEPYTSMRSVLVIQNIGALLQPQLQLCMVLLPLQPLSLGNWKLVSKMSWSYFCSCCVSPPPTPYLHVCFGQFFKLNFQISGDKMAGLAKFFLSIGIPGRTDDIYIQLESLSCLENNRQVNCFSDPRKLMCFLFIEFIFLKAPTLWVLLFSVSGLLVTMIFCLNILVFLCLRYDIWQHSLIQKYVHWSSNYWLVGCM